jgi:DnaJ-class molecular chaperone
MSDLYKVLGVSPQATIAEITSAYRNLAKIYHPDKLSGDQEKFKEIGQAYAILTDERKRQIYDLQGIDGVNMNDRLKSRTGETSGRVYEQSFKVPTNSTMFNNLFENFFGNPPACDTTVTPLVHIMEVDIKDVYNGCKKQFTYYRDLICQVCYGKGTKPHSQQIVCRYCKHKPNSQCEMCQGKGHYQDKCSQCQGAKIIHTENTIDVMIKPGMNDKFKINFENLGNEEPNKTTGDLIIHLSVSNHTPFEINNTDLKLHQNISLSEALNGVSRDIVFVDGNVIRLTTPMGQIVQTSEPVMYKSSGLPMYDEQTGTISYGDLYVYYNIVLPKKISTDVKKRISELITQ